MQIIDNLLILVLIAGAFLYGKYLGDKYHKEAETEKTYALQKQYVRLKAGCDADDPGQPYVAHPSASQPIPAEFIEHLRRNKRATMQL